MSREDGKKCPGVTKKGNPCNNYSNEKDPEGLCGRCRKRVSKAEKSAKKKAQEAAKEAERAQEQLDYDPDEVVICQARPDCGTEVTVGHEGTENCAQALSLKRIRALVRRTRRKRDPLEENRNQLARILQGQLESLKDGCGPFAVCPSCREGLEEFFEADDLFIDYSFAWRMYRRRKEQEEQKRAEAEAKAKELRNSIHKDRKDNEEKERKRRENLAQKGQAFMAGRSPVEPDKPQSSSQEEKSREFFRRLTEGEYTDASVETVFLPKVETDERLCCANPQCQERGTLADSARDDDGNVIMIERPRHNEEGEVEYEEVPLPKMWCAWQPLMITHKRGDKKGEVVVSDDGKEVVKARSLALCHKCGRLLRDSVEGAWTQPLRQAVEREASKFRQRSYERRNGNGNSNGDNRVRRRRRNKHFRAQTHNYGEAAPSEVGHHLNGNEKPIAKVGEVARRKGNG